MLKVLKLIKEEHLKDVEIAKRQRFTMQGLCIIAASLNEKGDITHKEVIAFRDFIERNAENPRRGGYYWSRDCYNTERLEWLNEQIAILEGAKTFFKKSDLRAGMRVYVEIDDKTHFVTPCLKYITEADGSNICLDNYDINLNWKSSNCYSFDIKRIFDVPKDKYEYFNPDKKGALLFDSDNVTPVKIGKWYYFDRAILYAQKVLDGDIYGYGVLVTGEWCDYFFLDKDNDIRLATDDEVKQMLIKEAKKRGFNRDNLKWTHKNRDMANTPFQCTNFTDLRYKSTGNALTLLAGLVFEGGVWADIVTEPVKKMSVEEIQIALGYKVEIVE